MAWVTPTNVATGDVLTAATWNQAVVANAEALAPFFGTWTSWTPTVAQGATSNITKTVQYAKYVLVGKLAIANVRIDVSGTGTAGSTLTISLPSEITSVSTMPRLGGAHIFDSSTGTRYTGQAEFVTTTTLGFAGDWSGNSLWGVGPNLAVGANDQIGFSVMYEVA